MMMMFGGGKTKRKWLSPLRLLNENKSMEEEDNEGNERELIVSYKHNDVDGI